MQRGLIVLAVLLLVTAAATVAVAAGRIVVREEAEARGPRLHLSDLARLAGDAEKWANLDLGESPAPGRVARLSGASLLDRLRTAGVNLEEITYVIPRLVRVRRRAIQVSATEVMEALNRRLKGQGGGKSGPEISVRRVDGPFPVFLAPGGYEMVVSWVGGAPVPGVNRVTLTFTQPGEPDRSVGCSVTVAAYDDVYVLRRGVRRGEVMRSTDLVAERRDLGQLPRDVVTDPEQAVGKRARTLLPAFAPVRLDLLDEDTVIHRGDIVTLLVDTPRMRITTAGEARERGRPGQRIRVRNRASRREVSGRVVDGGTVQVELGWGR